MRYPKPLGLSQWSRERLGIDGASLAFPPGKMEGMATPGDFDGSVARSPIELGHVVIPTYGSAQMSLMEAPGHEAMAALLGFSFNHYKHGARAFSLAAELANRVEVWRLDYDDPAKAAGLLLERIG